MTQVKTTRRSSVASVARTPRSPEAEAILRDVAYVLALTQSVKSEMVGVRPSAGHPVRN